MNIDDEGMLLSNIGICVGVAKDGRFKLAHLVVLERPQCIFTCPWNLDEHFETGRWYRQVRVKDEHSAITKTYWKLMDEFIPTILIRAGERFTLIEVSLPIYFAPDLSLFSSLQHKNSKVAVKPICPLFGQESVQILDLPVDGFSDRNGNSPVPGTLYCVRVQISFTPGLIPIWTYNENYVGTLDSFHWTSAFMAENSISTDIFKSYRVDGLVIEKIVRMTRQRKILNYYLILQENAKEFPPRLAIAVGHDADKYGGGKSLDVGDWISFLPIMLDCYTYPVLFALHCPSSNTISNKKLKLFKEPGGDYKLTLKITEEYLTFIQAVDNSNNNNCRLPVLGLLVDPFNCSKNLLNKLGHLVTIEIRPQWHMEKGVVIWTALNSCENLKVPVLETRKCFRDTASVDNFAINNNDNFTSNFSPLTGPNKLSLGSKRILAAYFTYKCSTNCFVFFEFCEITNTFSCRHDIPLQPKSTRNITIGDWYYIDFECISNKSEPVNVTSIRPTSPRIETRVRHNICAQFRGGEFAIVKFWHCSDHFCAGSQFYSDPDKIWWPDLCVKCFSKDTTTNTSPLNEGSTHFRPYSHFSSSSSHKSNCGSSTISSFSTTHSKNTNINFNKSNESIVKNRRFSIREQERREKLEQRERLDKLAELLENREKASYEEFKALRSTKPPKCSSSRSSIFSNGYRQSQQEKQHNKNFNIQTSSRTTYTGNNTTTYGQFIHQQNIPQEKQQNIHQNIYLDTRHNKQNINKNIEDNVCQNGRQNIHQSTYQNIQQNKNNEQEYFYQNIQQNKQQNINKNKEENVFKNKQQNKQPKPVNKCFSVQKKLNVENIENSTTTSSSTLKINNVEVDEEQNNNNDVYSSNNSLLNETLEIRTSESSDDNNEQHKQQQPFFGDNFNHQKAEIEILDENLIAEEFSSLKVSDTQTTKQQVVDEGEPGGFGYSRRRRFAFELKTNL
uniref:Uncharacterized protein n=1 Tax=Meloidogyne enterolobii TaxID=390850 RepID=A0A6V7WWT7_MELEN|nr:unnamed protein product [Meloidogyne enterolobii]